MVQLGIPYHDCHSVGTIIHMAVDGQYAGHIVISDVVKPNAKAAIAALHKAGVEKTVMLTGDAQSAAEGVARELGLDEFHAELLPGDKVDQVERLLAQKQKEQQDAINADRAGQVGTGDRSEKIRTYNFPQDRCTDHRIGLTVHNLDKIMDGNLDEIIDALAMREQAEKLRQLDTQSDR